MNYTFSDISSLNNAGIITFDSISARYVNLPYQYTIYIDSDCIIQCHALYFSQNIVYLSETYQNRYIIYITLDYFDQSISTRFQFRLKNAKDNSKIATKLQQYHQNEIIWQLVKIYNTNIEIPLDVKISIGVIFHNGTGGNVTFFKNVQLQNSDGLYLLNNNENNYVIVDITLWNMFYNASIIIVAIQSNIHSFVDSIIDVECTNDNCEISIVHENYVQLTAEERNKIINLGYTLIDYVI